MILIVNLSHKQKYGPFWRIGTFLTPDERQSLIVGLGYHIHYSRVCQNEYEWRVNCEMANIFKNMILDQEPQTRIDSTQNIASSSYRDLLKELDSIKSPEVDNDKAEAILAQMHERGFISQKEFNRVENSVTNMLGPFLVRMLKDPFLHWFYNLRR